MKEHYPFESLQNGGVEGITEEIAYAISGFDDGLHVGSDGHQLTLSDKDPADIENWHYERYEKLNESDSLLQHKRHLLMLADARVRNPTEELCQLAANAAIAGNAFSKLQFGKDARLRLRIPATPERNYTGDKSAGYSGWIAAG